MLLSIESIIREITKNPEHVIALLEYSYGNKFDYEVNMLIEDGVIKEDAQTRILTHYLKLLEER